MALDGPLLATPVATDREATIDTASGQRQLLRLIALAHTLINHVRHLDLHTVLDYQLGRTLPEMTAVSRIALTWR